MTESLVDGDLLRAAMRQVASPVVVITTISGEGMRGMTASSFTSVSLQPPLISFNVAKDTQMHLALEETECFAVHVLSANQTDLSQHFAVPHLSSEEQFKHIACHIEETLPILEDTLAVLICKPFAQHEAGDHTLFLGEVIRIGHLQEGNPLLYFQRHYCTTTTPVDV